MTLEEKLAQSKQLEEKIKKGISMQRQNKKPSDTIVSNNITALDNAVFGKPVEINRYSADDEMKRIKERNKNGSVGNFSNSKIPAAILESIKQNPLNVEVTDQKMEQFTEKLSATVPTIQRSLEIQKKLENQTNASADKSCAPQTSKINSSIDYEMIKMIVENAVKKEVSSLKENILNENLTHVDNSSSFKALKLTENGRFIFLDNDDNLYECSMKYIGKNKKRKS